MISGVITTNFEKKNIFLHFLIVYDYLMNYPSFFFSNDPPKVPTQQQLQPAPFLATSLRLTKLEPTGQSVTVVPVLGFSVNSDHAVPPHEQLQLASVPATLLSLP